MLGGPQETMTSDMLQRIGVGESQTMVQCATHAHGSSHFVHSTLRSVCPSNNLSNFVECQRPNPVRFDLKWHKRKDSQCPLSPTCDFIVTSAQLRSALSNTCQNTCVAQAIINTFLRRRLPLPANSLGEDGSVVNAQVTLNNNTKETAATRGSSSNPERSISNQETTTATRKILNNFA